MKRHIIGLRQAMCLGIWLCGHGSVLAQRSGGPLFSFGVIADCQYCNVKVPKTATRQYALSPKKLTACVEHLNRLDLQFVVHLGDFIDRDFKSFADVAPIYDNLKADHYHVLGNHDFEVADDLKARVPAALGLKSRYYQFRYHGYRFIALDGNDVSLHAYPTRDPRHRAAEAVHRKLPDGTPIWNGAVGQAQLDWLKKTLGEARQVGERVVLFCHFPVYPENVHNLWNAAEVLAVVRESRSVVAYMNGHNHDGNYGRFAKRHFVTFKGMVDTEETAYAVVQVHKDRLEITGFGRQKSMTLPFAGNGD
ncbi:MAG: metallophosphoesterase [Verrucomicrobiota bacterium]|nr:metallophosphoesterase [Verrucomicrobiota bacterium]